MRSDVDGVASVWRLLSEASRHGAAWPPNQISGSHMIAQICGILALVRGRGSLLAKAEGKGVHSILEILTLVDGIQAAIFRTHDLRNEVIYTAERFNSLVMWLDSEAQLVAKGDPKKARDQFTIWWGQLGDAMLGYAQEVVPAAMTRQIPVLIRQLVFQMVQSLATPVVQMPSGQTLPGPAGGPLAAFADTGGSTSGGSGISGLSDDVRARLSGAATGGGEALANLAADLLGIPSPFPKSGINPVAGVVSGALGGEPNLAGGGGLPGVGSLPTGGK